MDEKWNINRQTGEVPKGTKLMRTILAAVVSFIGFVLLFSQIVPLVSSYAIGKVDEIKASRLVKPIPDAHKELVLGAFAYYNPGESYFRNIARQLGELTLDEEYSYDPTTRQSKKIVVDKEYNKAMQISIPVLDINKVKISSNVESYDEDVYNLKLKDGVAHFKGTPLPGDGGNSFIYGHSAVPSFFNRNQNLAETIFSKLEKVDIGAQISVFKDGKELKYIVRKKKIVEPTDFSILKTQGDKETVTLMTCWPVGVPTKRLIILGERYE